ncbi:MULTISPECIES: phage holin family protein [Cyanophyceae]|uniref:phage holin family protein n=1 Tax=Cyanophyceae TaxID=3028117 RepID=UPI001689D04F|nr:phage holin family protein [Trichocoleus sp. FACHB-40]MBD2002444.1 phage holin family protein [Trichocoleus sp. FACHB-40]
MDFIDLLIAWLVSASSLLIISQIPVGVEIDSTPKAFVSAAVLGIVAAIVRPIMGLVFAIPNFLTFNLLSGLFTFIVTVATFMLAASLVHGFRLRLGIWSAVIGAIALSFVSNLIYNFI